MPGMELVPVGAPDLSYRDIRNTISQFPPYGADDQPNWAVAGGGAAKLLVEAFEVRGRPFAFTGGLMQRGHHDLDLYVFRPEPEGRFAFEHPHKVYRTRFFGPLSALNLRRAFDHSDGFYIEMLHAYYFGFAIPQPEDVVHVRLTDGWVPVLSPEFIIASRLFHNRGLRPGMDNIDIMTLQKRFHLDYPAIRRIVRRSPFRFLKDTHIDAIVVEQDVNLLISLANTEASHRFQKRPVIEKALAVHPDFIRGSLAFEPEWFTDAQDAAAFKRAAILAKDELDNDPRSTEILKWGRFFALYQLGPKAKLSVELVSAAKDRRQRTGSVAFLGLSMEFAAAMARLRRAVCSGELRDKWGAIALRLVLKFFATDYIHAFLAKVGVTANILDNPSLSDDVKSVALTDLILFTHGINNPKELL